jgi:enterochelin esterase-like enzyme
MNAIGPTPRFGSVDIAAHRSPDGIQDITVLSPALRRRADVSLFIPDGADADAPLPLLVLLHGVYGSHWSWARSGRAHDTVQRLVQAKAIQPMVIAMPSDGLIGVGSGYVAGGEVDAEAWIADEVPAVARLRYPGAGAAGMAVAGLSMGGWGALRLAARRRERYGAAVGMSPLTHWAHVGQYAEAGSRYESTPEVEQPDLAELLISTKTALPPLRITCGTGDALLPHVAALRARLEAEGVEFEYEESDGGHEWPVWERELRSSLLFIDRHLQSGVDAHGGPES